MPAGLKIDGLKELNGKFDKLDDFRKWATPPMHETLDALHSVVQTYPPPKPTYTRTGTLKASIIKQIRTVRGGIQGIVKSIGANQGRGFYEHFVKVREFQAWMHQGWWPTTEDDVNTVKPYGEKFFKEAIDRLLGR